MNDFLATLSPYWPLPPIFFVPFMFVVGLLVGSFINVVIYRLPRMGQDRETENGERAARFDLAFPGSHCPHCGHAIRWRHNLPIVSYLWLKGRCYDCRAPIGIRYPIVEALTALCFVVAAWRFGPSSLCWAVCVFSCFAMALSALDIESMWLPDGLTQFLLWSGFWFNLSGDIVSLQESVVGAMAGYLFLWGLYWLFKWATGKEGLGGGDFKLLAGIGAYIGWVALPVAILIGAVTALITIVFRKIALSTDLKAPIPFGPFLAFGGWIVLLSGNPFVFL